MFLSPLFYCFIGVLKQLIISAKQLLDLLLILVTYGVNLYKKEENEDFFFFAVQTIIKKARLIKIEKENLTIQIKGQ